MQTVDAEANPRYDGLIREFERITGVPVLLNTSFNRQEPIVASPTQAISCFLRTDMDVLVMGNYYSTDRHAKAIKKAGDIFKVQQRRARHKATAALDDIKSVLHE